MLGVFILHLFLMMTKYFLIVTIIFLSLHVAFGQVRLTSNVDFGENNASDGAYLMSAFGGAYQMDDYLLGGIVQLKMIGKQASLVSVLKFNALKEIELRDIPLSLNAYLMFNRATSSIRETNFGISISNRSRGHFKYVLGSNFRTYAINYSALDKSAADYEQLRIHENFGLIYNISGYIKPLDHKWNIGASITNIDYFLINQATNPLYNAQFLYSLNSKVKLRFESWFKQAGIFNINAHYFGYFFRGGITWQL